MVLAQGERLVAPAAFGNFHPFAATLKQWETGMLVD
jgi:hypothetical protein